jgi:hypothetical protein
MVHPVELGGPPSDSRFLFMQMVPCVSDKNELESEFWQYFFINDDPDNSIITEVDRVIRVLQPSMVLISMQMADRLFTTSRIQCLRPQMTF